MSVLLFDECLNRSGGRESALGALLNEPELFELNFLLYGRQRVADLFDDPDQIGIGDLEPPSNGFDLLRVRKIKRRADNPWRSRAQHEQISCVE
ncbi:hypothetical protein [Bradyrhizobium guangxiense]|uniref:hypothetical protein n=1 Tax=Bradyrhizobium guangxiense TaxID=1325115 RepID=UPI0013E8DFE7|nr:hypothetical protein [Bradyrhizobium guangxiense]